MVEAARKSGSLITARLALDELVAEEADGSEAVVALDPGEPGSITVVATGVPVMVLVEWAPADTPLRSDYPYRRWYYVVNTPIRHSDGTVSKQAMISDIDAWRKLKDPGIGLTNPRFVLTPFGPGRLAAATSSEPARASSTCCAESACPKVPPHCFRL